MAELDAVVIGLGATGSAALHRLASRGQRVLGIEQFTPGHDRGSSHGATRVIRLDYFEHPSYVPLLKRAYELWRALESKRHEQLLYVTGSIDAGRWIRLPYSTDGTSEWSVCGGRVSCGCHPRQSG